jgi:bifunctional non-homologous end joining protein LigD
VTTIEVDGRRLKVSNLEKVLYPEAGFTKGEVLDYYTRVSPLLLPHLRGRPLTLKRYPDGVDAGFFYEKQCPGHRPDWVETAAVWSRHNNRTIDFCLANDLPTLVWVANLASLELHTALHRAPGETPDSVVFDLDPGDGAGTVECARVALWLREALDHLNLRSPVVKASGSKGIQVYVPLNTPVTYDQTKGFSHALAQLLERVHRDLVVSNMAKELRKGKVLIDWSQNDEHKTTVCVYSLRARPQPTVSLPLTWEEVETAAAGGGLPPLTAPDVLERVAGTGDLFAPLLAVEQALPSL